MSTLDTIEANQETFGAMDAGYLDSVRPALIVCLFSPATFTASQMHLNWDILVEIMFFSDRADASRMSRTCRTLLQAAPQTLLSRNEAFPLLERQQLLSFLLFMFCGRHNGFRYLNQLRLYEVWRSLPQLEEHLTDLFMQATELKLVTLEGEKVELGERVSYAFANLTKLRTLKIDAVTDRTAELFKKMQAPLTGIDANFLGYHDSVDPIPMFAHFKHSLRAMNLSFAGFSSTEIQYPRVVSLSAEYCEYQNLVSIVHCFPSLRDLSLHAMEEDLDMQQEISITEEERLSSLASQTRRTQWPSLHRLSGGVRELYTLGIRCRVDHVDVARWPLNSAVDGQRLAAIVADVRPTSLDARLLLPEFELLSLAEHLTCVRDELVGLRLRLDYQYEEPCPCSAQHEDPCSNVVRICPVSMNSTS
ncbi:uncharacterized protein PHACADRAFT_33920 [Phanerochaete carnosa HHB-10118-sp]|uniref:F-box domain-containing protein n=1 Tax=Phanerochaete carnosa (strain HHB-10118-sp) TaxID=650164 RepID=K5VNT5_PHACS|nr:uncharacterized protein PHACADRAFT_33920 [Phanerochaete carnosa HHB-10118-sp]EKM48355.1 hypothetical protein PHACADRAFT_33920 [Phanerochaete carnosa HHB-10118-sp]